MDFGFNVFVVVVCFTLFWMVYGVVIWVGFDYMF